MRLTVLIVPTLLLSFVGLTHTTTHCSSSLCVVNDTALRFHVLGDFGGWEVWPYFSPAQKHVADKMAAISDAQHTHFQIELGDNFYYFGVTDVENHRFQDTFENVYDKTNTYLNKPWYLIAGNHDHYGNVSAQIIYNGRSERWDFPSLYYKFSYKLKNGVVAEFVMIDTVTLCGNTRFTPPPRDASWLEKILWDGDDYEPPKGPENVRDAEVQWIWIEEQLKTSTADYLFVAGHFPVYSIASHGPTQCLVDRLKPMLYKHKVTAYLSGHDHQVQHLKETTAEGTMHYILSGAASQTKGSTEHVDDCPAGSLQFYWPHGFHPTGLVGFDDGAFVYMTLDANIGHLEVHTGTDNPVQYAAVFDKRAVQQQQIMSS